MRLLALALLLCTLLMPGCGERSTLPSSHESRHQVAPEPVTPKRLLPADNPDPQRLGRWEGEKFHWDAPVVTGPSWAIELSLPAGHDHFTVVIDDLAGRRVRNLLSMAEIHQHLRPGEANDSAAVSGDRRTQVVVAWNGLDDDGRPVPPGDYRVHGVSLPRVKPLFDFAWYNPGDPPWEGHQGSGWGGDHAFPTAVACARGKAEPWSVAISGIVAEAGDAVLTLNPDYKKVWGFKQFWWGAWAMALTDQELWMVLHSDNELRRFAVGSGQPLPFQRPAGVIEAVKLPGQARRMALLPRHLALLLNDPTRLLLLDRQTAREVGSFNIQAHALAADAEGRLLAADDTHVFVVHWLDPNTQSPSTALTLQPLHLDGLTRPGQMALSDEGHLYIFDRGSDQQVKVFNREGEVLCRIGTQGGQRGLAYDPLAIRPPADLDVDSHGRVWLVESEHPRRVAVFNPDGSLHRQFVGNTSYGMWGMTLHDQDARVGYGWNTIFRIDPAETHEYAPLAYAALTPPRESRFTPLLDSADANWMGPEHGEHIGHYFYRSQLFESSASGTSQTYLLDFSAPMPVLCVRQPDGAFRAVAAAGQPQHKPALAMPGVPAHATVFWADANRDSRVQSDELTLLTADPVRLSWLYGWTHLMGQDLAFRVAGREIAPVRFDPDGTPRYDPARYKPLAVAEPMIPVGRHLVTTQGDSFYRVGHYLFTDPDGSVRATYPIHWTGVHSSMVSPLPEAGQTCGELFFSGVAPINEQVGYAIASHGNFGQAFIFSEDGLFLTSLFKDLRDQPGMMGERMNRGADWSKVTMGQESFGGWFGCGRDGVLRYMFGRNACLVVQLTGLDQARRFDAGRVLLTQTAATNASPARHDIDQPSTHWRAQRLANQRSLAIDGNLSDWPVSAEETAIRVGRAKVAAAQLAADGQAIYLAAEVQDGSPLARDHQVDARVAFKAGDAVDLHLGLSDDDAAAVRLLLLPGSPDGRTAARLVRYRPRLAPMEQGQPFTFTSPGKSLQMEDVRVVAEAQLAFVRTETGYTCEARIPLSSLPPAMRARLPDRGDVGVLFSHPSGRFTQSRAYRFDTTASAVADIPSEAELRPRQWGVIHWEDAP